MAQELLELWSHYDSDHPMYRAIVDPANESDQEMVARIEHLADAKDFRLELRKVSTAQHIIDFLEQL